MNQKFQGFPLTRKPSWKNIIVDAALLVALVIVLGVILYVGVNHGL